MATIEELTGRGIRFPLAPAPGLALVTGADLVEQSLRSILLTQPGERIARPAYGAGLRRFLYASNNIATRSFIRDTVSRAIERDEPRVELEAVDVLTEAGEETVLLIDIRYRLLEEPDPRRLVFPFYLDGDQAA